MQQSKAAPVEAQAAYERYNYAGAALELARIKERLAEMASQRACRWPRWGMRP